MGSLRRSFFRFASNAVRKHHRSAQALLTLASPSAQVVQSCISALRSSHTPAQGAKICPLQPRHASVMDGPVSESRIWFINTGAYTVMTLGGVVEKRKQNPASPRSLPVCDGHWKGLRGKLWHPRAGAFISQHIHFASVTDAGMEGGD
jgi:hypothetical protein